MSFDLLKAVPIIHVTLSNMKKAVLHDGWSLSSPNYHHTDQYLTVNIDVLACMVSTSYLVQICRYAEMQICRYAPISQDQKWHTQNLNSTAQRFERSQTQKKHKNTKEHKNSNRVGCPNKLSFLSNVASNFISPCFPYFFPFSNAFPSDLQSIKDACPFRPQVSSQLSSQTAAVGSTRAQSSSSTQQPGDRRTALLSPAVGLLLSLRLTWHTALLSPPAVGLLLSLKLTWHAAPLFPAVGLLLSLKLTWHAAPLSPAVGLLLSLRLVCHTALLPLQLIDSPFQLVYLAVLPPFWQQICSTCNITVLRHDNPQIFLAAVPWRNHVKPRSDERAHRACQRTREQRQNWKWSQSCENLRPSSCSIQFNTKIFTLFSRSFGHFVHLYFRAIS